MNVHVDKYNFLFYIVAFCILTSPGLSYSVLYPIHLILPFILIFILNSYSKKNFITNRFSFGLILFFMYSCFSIIYLSNYDLYYKYIFYLFVSFSSMIYLYGYMVSKGYSLVVRVFLIYALLMIFIAFLEALGIARMPFSPYSSYYSLFGKTIDVSEWSDEVFSYNTQKPTVFSSNPNTFGFILMCYLPFIFLLKNNILKILLFVISFFILYKIDSKMLLITFLFFIALKYFLISSKKSLYILLSLGLIIFLYPLLSSLNSSGFFDSRMFTAVDEIGKGWDYLTGKSVAREMDSTGERAFIYSLGIDKIIETNGIGLGLSGIETYLMFYFGKHTAFHNFFLMMLVDLGLIGFIAVVFFYIYTIKRLYLGLKINKGTELGSIYEAFFLGMISSVFASITPSGIIYLLPYWFFVAGAAYMAFNYKKLS